LISRSEGNLSPARTLNGVIPTYIVAPDGVTAGVIVKALGREGLEVAARWGTLAELTASAQDRVELVIILEPGHDGYSNLEYANVISAHGDAIIVVVASALRDQLQRLVWAGVDAVLLEPRADAVVGPVVRSLLAGYVVVPRTLRAGVQPPPLTRRERQMLGMVVEGRTNREIADRLFLAESTVKRHLSSTFRRLGVSSRREAAAAVLASEQGFGLGAKDDETGRPESG
jgi:DNA-binding NarL/FixJ family response regulator